MKNDNEKDDIEMVPDEESDGGNPAASLKKLREKLKACQKEKDEYLAGWQRAKADLINYKREVETNKGELAKFANENLMRDLLSVLDSFDMAFMNKETWESVPEGWRKGVEYIHTQFLTVLRENNLEQINPFGEAFDPARHEPVETVLTDEKSKDHTVVEVLQRGYVFHGKVIRPARVHIAEFQHKE